MAGSVPLRVNMRDGAVLLSSQHGKCGAADEPFGDEEIGDLVEPGGDDIGWDGMASG